MWEITCSYLGHDLIMCGTWLIENWDTTHSYVGQGSIVCEKRHTPRHPPFSTHSYVGHDSFICGTWLIHMWDMTHSYLGNDSFTCETTHTPRHPPYLTHSHLGHDPFTTWDMTYPYMGRDSFVCGTRLIHVCDNADNSERVHDCFSDFQMLNQASGCWLKFFSVQFQRQQSSSTLCVLQKLFNQF